MHEFIFGIIGSKFFPKKKRPVQKDAEVQAFVILNSKMSYLKNFWGYDS
jgi:hypothetical protein